jgi:glycosyltransferase involved in cell wall biosynthesis
MIDRNIIIIGQQPWDTEIGSNCKNIALELSKKNRVLYVNSPLDRITRYKDFNDPRVKKRIEIINTGKDGLLLIQDNLWNLYPDCMVESVNWIRNPRLFNYLNKRNNRKFSLSIMKAVKELGFVDFVLFNDNELFKGFYLKEFLAPAVSIYYSRDYMLAVDYWRRHGRRLEPLLIRQNDLCVTNSEYLADYCRNYNDKSYNIGQGCDLEIFKEKATAIRPPEMDLVNTPVIGYVGALQSSRLNLSLLKYIATMLPDWTVVLVGGEDKEFQESDLHMQKNVIFTGIKPIAELPVYMQFFDVCINPQSINEVTIGNYPRKIDEYLAMGKPVVATATKTMEIFKEYVYLAKEDQEYIPLILEAYKNNNEHSKQQRREFASSHTWENCINKLYKLIDDFEIDQ